MLLINYLLLKHAKKATSPKFSRLMPKASEIVLENEKRTDICINPVISIWWAQRDLNSHRTNPIRP